MIFIASCVKSHSAAQAEVQSCRADESSLNEYLRVQVAESVKPTLVIFTMDGSIGQAAFDQAKAFRDSVEVRCACWGNCCFSA